MFGPAQAGHYLLVAQSGPITVLAREGRRTLPAVEVQGHQMVGLDDLATLFQLQVRDDPAARAITATYKNQTIVLTPDQSLVSSSGRLFPIGGIWRAFIFRTTVSQTFGSVAKSFPCKASRFRPPLFRSPS